MNYNLMTIFFLFFTHLGFSLPLAAQLGGEGVQFWNQSSPGLNLVTQTAAEFGRAVAAGDFDCDGYDDLAIGMPRQDIPNIPLRSLSAGSLSLRPLNSNPEAIGLPFLEAGQVVVLYSSGGGGLATQGSQVWNQETPGIEDNASNFDHFGWVLTVGDFDGDDCEDLVIGIPREDIGGDLSAGAVSVIYGSNTGLSSQFDDFWHQDLATLEGAAEPGDLFGSSLAVGDFNDDGLDDLAVGSPGENIGAVSNAGMVHVLFGTVFGLGAGNSVALWRGNGLGEEPQVNEGVGLSLAAGQMTFVPGEELVIGAPSRNLPGADQAGVIILVSDVDGLVLTSEWSQASPDVPGTIEDFDRFGSELAVGDFDGDGIDELAVGIPEEDIGNPVIGSAGAVNILDFDNGSHQLWTQDDLNPEQTGLNERFGQTLAVGDFDGDGVDDLAIAAPLEDLGPLDSAGLLHVLHGEVDTGLSNDRDQIWLQLLDPSDEGDQFGFSLAAGHFTGQSGSDLAIGVPFETLGAVSETGGVNVMYSISIFNDGFESGDTSQWSSTEP